MLKELLFLYFIKMKLSFVKITPLTKESRSKFAKAMELHKTVMSLFETQKRLLKNGIIFLKDSRFFSTDMVL